jgi:hypothetical protein
MVMARSNSPKSSDLSHKVLDSIKHRSVKMHPKSYYLWLGIITVLGAMLLVGLSALLCHILVNDIDHIRQSKLLDFGSSGRSLAFGSFPWVLLALTVAFVTATYYFLKRFDISYRKSLAFFSLGVISLVGIISVVIGIFGLEDRFDDGGVFHGLQTLHGSVEDQKLEGRILANDDGMLTIISEDGVKKVGISGSELSGEPRVGSSLGALGEWDDDETFNACCIHIDAPDGMDD